MIGTSLWTSLPSMTHTLLFSSFRLIVALLLRSHLLLLLLPFSILGSCFKSWALITVNSTNRPSFSSLSPQRMALSLQFPETSLEGRCFLLYFSLLLGEEYFSLSLFSAATLFAFLALNAANFLSLSAASNADPKPGVS